MLGKAEVQEQGRAWAFQREQNEQTPAGDWGVAKACDFTSWVEKCKTRIGGQEGGNRDQSREGQGPERMKERGMILTH